MSRILVFVNPQSGRKKGLKILDQVTGMMHQSNIETSVHVSRHPGHFKKLSRTISLEGYQGICVIGGDGTLHEVINGLLKRTDRQTPPLGLVPAGTGNSLLHDLNLLTVEDAVRSICQGQARPIDIFKIRSGDDLCYAFNVIGWGIPGDLNVLAESLRWAGGQRYNLAAMIEIMRNRHKKASIDFNGEQMDGFFGFIVACNTQFAGNGMRLSPQAQIDDGLIDLLILRKVSRFKLLTLFMKVFSGSHLPDPDIVFRQVKSFSIHCQKGTYLNVDGENTLLTPCDISLLPGRLRIFANSLNKVI